MENRLLENRLLAENGHSRNYRFAGVATALILLGVSVVCVVTYKVGPGAGAYDAVEMLSKGEEEYMRAYYETSSCPAELATITSPECMYAAVKYGLPFSDAIDELQGSDWPPGCFMLDTDKIYFNKWSPGAAHKRAAPICGAPPLVKGGSGVAPTCEEAGQADLCADNCIANCRSWGECFSTNSCQEDETCDMYSSWAHGCLCTCGASSPPPRRRTSSPQRRRTPSPPPPTASRYFCGKSWGDANANCDTPCEDDHGFSSDKLCTNGETCWKNVCGNPTPPQRRRAPSPPPPSQRRRGPSPPTPPSRRRSPSPPGSLLIEGYFPGYGSNAAALAQACKSGWRLAAGAFQQSIQVPPPTMEPGCDNWLVLGGAGVGMDDDGQPGQQYSASMVVSQMNSNNYQNVDFDMEGVLKGQNDVALTLASDIKAQLPGAKFQFTIMGSFPQTSEEFKFLKTNHGPFDTIALMLYGNFMNGYGWEIDDEIGYKEQATWKWLMEWVDEADIPNDKIMIGLSWLFDSQDPTLLTPGWVINAYKELVQEEKLKGLFFWDALNTPLKQMGDCLNDKDTECPHDHPYAEGCLGPRCPDNPGWGCVAGAGNNGCGDATAWEPCKCMAGTDENH